MRPLMRFAAALYPRWWRARYGGEFIALIEDLSPRCPDVLNVLGGALRMQIARWTFGKIAAALGTAGVLLGTAISFTIPDKYVSEFVLKAPSDNVAPRVHEALTRETLTRIMEHNRLYESDRASKPMVDVVDKMRHAIRIERLEASAVRMAFVYEDPSKAQQTSRELASSFVNAQAFEVLDPPSLDRSPIFPNRPLVAALGLSAGLLLATVVTLFRRPAPKQAS